MTKRWVIEIRYNFNGHPEVHRHEIDELDEIAQLVEDGPDHRLLVDITFHHQLKSPPDTIPQFLTKLFKDNGVHLAAQRG